VDALFNKCYRTIVNGMMLRKTQVDLQQRGDSTQFELRNVFRNLLDTAVSVYLSGTGVLHESSYQAALRRCSLSYLGFGWTNAAPVLIRVDTAGVAVDAMTLRRNATTVTLTGSRSFAGAYNAGLVIDSMQLQELEYLLSRSREALAGRSFRGTMHLEANLTGTDARPEIAVEVAIPNLAYMNNPLGMFEAEPRYQPGMLEVYSRLRYGSGGAAPRDVFTANGYYPLAFSLNGADASGADTAGSYRLLVGMNEFPLEIVETFATPFSSLRGTANAELMVHKVDGRPALSGDLDVAAARGRFAMNNMTYQIDLRLSAEPGLLRLDTLRVANDAREWNRGVLFATGDVSLDGLAVRAYEIDIDGRLKILNRASRASLKMLYGDLFFSTGNDELRFMGDKRGASFTGDLRIDQGDLIYNPNAGGAADAQRTRISFLDVDDRSSSKETSLSAAAETNGAAGEEEGAAADGGFLRQFTYALDVSTLGALRVSMPISALSQAELNARLDVSGLEVNNLDGEAKFIGVVTLGPESDFLMLGTKFVATGSITFSGDPQNPDLGLRAVYTNTHEDPVTREKRKACVIISIGGTLLKPEIAWDLRWDTPESQQRPRGGDVQSDALSFILLGLFSDELTSSSGNPLLDKLDAVSTALTSGLISKGMSDIINRVGLQDVFKRVELGGIGSNDTRVRLTSEIGRVLISYDGRVNDLSSSEIVFELPMNVLFPYSGFGPLVFQASAKTTGSSIESASSSQTEPVYEMKLLYRITF
jgi:hypothetical protein